MRLASKKSLFSILLASAAMYALPTTQLALAESTDKQKLLEQRRIAPVITITEGYIAPVPQLPGAASVISQQELNQSNSTDIHHVIRRVPGVNVQEEEGFGLRPNIGLRGGRVDRSADITLMEDGVLIAPAPYSAPAAYYFPRLERMEEVEVRKGSSSIKYGPRTTNGAINFVTRSVPEYFGGDASVSFGNYGSRRSSLNVGNTVDNFGFFFSGNTAQSDGFKNLDFSNADTGFTIQDYMGKLKFRTDAAARYYQEIEFKAGYTDETSDETYLGLTTADFRANPNRRYAASGADRMRAKHSQFQLSYYIEPTSNLGIGTTVYRNNFDRNWNKLQSVTANGTTQSLGNVLNDPITFADHYDALRNANGAVDALTLRANKRSYYAQGIQTDVSYNIMTGPVRHNIETGIRYHYDEEDRLQYQSGYQLVNGSMVLTSRGATGSQDNRVGSAHAFAGYILNRMEFGKWAVTPGIRYENIRLESENFGTADAGRSGANKNTFRNRVTAFVPGLGLEYALTNELTLITGVHKGFAPPAPPSNAAAAQNAKEEKSINYEVGARYADQNLRWDLIGYYTDYDNLLGADTFSAGGAGTGDQFNGGEVRVYGLEAAVGYNLAALTNDEALKSRYRFPVTFSYTYTRAEFETSFNSSFGEWGNVQKGDRLPYIPTNQFFASLGVETDDWLVNLSGRYTDRMRTVAGKGSFDPEQSTDRMFIMDANAEYELIDGLRGFVSAQNILDKQYIVARRPAGARPNAPRLLFAGVKVQF